ncbi:MAG: hypothetical protein Q4D38_11625 [Planctomycetia bacterium]|nr:hypothetical protein [Planctomycetia bacterium]
MAVLVSVRPGGESYDRTLEQSGQLRTIKEALSFEYGVIATSNDESRARILSTLGVPRVGDYNGLLVCKKVSLKSSKLISFQGRTTKLYTISAEYETMTTPDPTELPPEVSWDAECLEIRCDKDVEDEKDVENSAGEPLILTRALTVVVLNVSRYYEAAAFSPALIFEYTNTVSAGEFWGAPAEHAKLEKITIAYETVDLPSGEKKRYAKVSFVVKFKFLPDTEKPWKASLLDFGTRCRNPQSGKIERALDTSTARPIEVKLDGKGNRLEEGAEGVYLDFNVYKVKDFGPLGIDQKELGF